MKRNLILIFIAIVLLLLGFNSFKRILALEGTSKNVEKEEAQLQVLRTENASLKQELEYKKSQRFAEQEIRNKLGLAKEGEEVVVVLKKDDGEVDSSGIVNKKQLPKWKKWKKLFFGKA
jgi:cell division protein FtsB